MIQCNKATVIMTEEEYEALREEAVALRQEILTQEERETMVLALRLMRIRETARTMEAVGGRVNGRTLGEHFRTATRLIARLEGRN